MKFDVLIVGGGPAGLSAALLLGRCRRWALLCDEGHQRNLSSPAIHGLLGHKAGLPPPSWTRARYNSVFLRSTRVIDIVPMGGQFEFTCADGTTGNASKNLKMDCVRQAGQGHSRCFMFWGAY